MKGRIATLILCGGLFATGCGGPSSLTQEEALERLTEAGVVCRNPKIGTAIGGRNYMSCNVTSEGSFTEETFYVEFDQNLTEGCSEIDPDDPVLNQPTARGENWYVNAGALLTINLTGTTVDMKEVADALGGEAMTLRGLCGT